METSGLDDYKVLHGSRVGLILLHMVLKWLLMGKRYDRLVMGNKRSLLCSVKLVGQI